MSAIADSDEPTPVIQVLFALYNDVGLQDLAGPYEVLSQAFQQGAGKSDTKAFECTVAAKTQGITTSSGLTIKADCDYEDAHDDLSNYDVVVIPGGPLKAVEAVLNDPKNETTTLISAFAELQKTDPSKERTLLSVGTGSLILGHAGLLQGLAATTHPDYYTKFELICQEAARRGDLEQTDVMEENYVVNNARFVVDEDNLEDNPFILKKKPDTTTRRKSIGRKGSNAWRESVRRRESAAQRATLRLGGLRVITTGGKTSGLDAALYIISSFSSHEAAEEASRLLGYKWERGVCVGAIDV